MSDDSMLAQLLAMVAVKDDQSPLIQAERVYFVEESTDLSVRVREIYVKLVI